MYVSMNDLQRWFRNFETKDFRGQPFYDLMHQKMKFQHDKTNDLFGLYEGDFNGVALGVGLGYQTTNTADVEDVFNALVPGAPPVSEGVSMDIIGVSVDAGFSNGLSLGVNHSVLNIDGDEGKHTALGVGYEMNALAIGLNWGQFTADGDVISSGFGLAAAYDLGGGLAAQFGYGHSNFDVLDVTANTFSLGLAMSF